MVERAVNETEFTALRRKHMFWQAGLLAFFLLIVFAIVGIGSFINA